MSLNVSDQFAIIHSRTAYYCASEKQDYTDGVASRRTVGHSLFRGVRHPIAQGISGLLVALQIFLPTFALAQEAATAPVVDAAVAPSDAGTSSDASTPTDPTPVLDTALPGAAVEDVTPQPVQDQTDPTTPTTDTIAPDVQAATVPIDESSQAADAGGQQQSALSGSGDTPPTIAAPNALSTQNAQPKVDANTGALTFRIPLDIPPGRNGVQPDIALVYNSQNTQDGLVGYGWELSIPYITRLSKTGSNNLYNSGLFTSSLDGELATSSANVYRGRVDESRRTYSFSSNTWTVYDKNGTRYLFGSASQSQLAATTSASNVYRWYLDEIRDTNNNYVKYTYSRDGNQLYPSQITYTGSGTTDGPFTITFTTASRPDPIIDYRPGFRVETTSRITQIRANISGSMVRQYDFSYTSGNNTKRSLLSSIQQSGNGDSGTTTLPPIAFSYISTTTQFVTTGGLIGPAWIAAPGNGNGVNQRTVMYAPDSITPPTANIAGSNNSAPDYWSYSSNGSDPHPPLERGTRYVDINADGKTDVVRGYWNYTNSTSTNAIYVNTTSASTTSYSWTSTTTGLTTVPAIDYDGSGSVHNLSTGVFADVNADGFPDFLQRVDGYYSAASYFGNGSSWSSASSTYAPPMSFPQAFSSSDTNAQLIDINGDGLADWLYTSGTSTYVRLNTGSGWNADPDPAWTIATTTLYSAGSGAIYDRGIRFQDINGDGLADFIHAYALSYTWDPLYTNAPLPETQNYSTVWLNTGSGWATSTAYSVSAIAFPIPVTGSNNAWAGQFAYNELANWIGNGQMAQDVLSTITYPKGGSTDVTYANSTQTNQNPALPYEVLTVASLTNHDGLGSNEQVTYAFGGGQQYYPANIIDRKFAGFATTTITTPLSVTTTYFNQADATSTYTGEQSDGYAQINHPYRVDIRTPSGTLIQQTFTRWDATRHGNVFFLAKGREVVQSYAADATHRDRATDYSYSTSTDDLLTATQYGEVTGNSDGTFADTGSDGRVSTYTYVASSSVNLSLPIEKKITTLNGGTQTTADYYTSGSGDCDVRDQIGTFSAMHSASSGSAVDNVTICDGAIIWNNGTLWAFTRMFLPFDTTGIPANATVNAATLYVRGYKYVNGGNVSLIPSTQASTTALALSDYGKVDFSTQLAADKDSNDWGASPGTMQGWALNGTGVAYVKPASTTKMAIITSADRVNTSPGEGVGNNFGLVNIYSSRAASDHPYLHVTYTSGGGGTGTTMADTKYYYDNLAFGSVRTGNRTRQEDWKSGTSYASSTAGYNSYGLVASSTDRNGATTTYAYDAYNLYPATVTNALGRQTQYTYHYANGQVSQTTDPNGRLSKNFYDGVGRLAEVDQSDLTTPATLVTATTYTYTDSSSPPSIMKKSDYLTATTTVDTYTFTDGLGREIQRRAQNNAGSYTATDKTYDSAGMLHSASLPYFSAGTSYTSPTTTAALLSIFTYDALGRTATTTNVLGTIANAYSKWTTTVTDLNGHLKDYTKDAFGNLAQVIERTSAGNYTTTYAYDTLDNLASTTDALGNVRSFTYDGLSRRLTATDLRAPADGTYGTYTYTYDDNGNLTRVVDPKSQTINRTYDALSRMKTEDYTGSAGNEVSLTYDTCTYGIGYLCYASSTGARLSQKYDVLGRVSVATTTIKTSIFTATTTYDRQGNVTSLVYPSGSRITYLYGAGGLVSSVIRTATTGATSSIASQINYAPTSALSHLLFFNNIETTRSYNASALYRLSNILTVATTTSQSQGMMMMSMPGGGGTDSPALLSADSTTTPAASSTVATQKGAAMTAQLSPEKLQRAKYTIEVIASEPIEDGVQIFARAWNGSQQIGFGEDGTVDIERFRIFNPPLLVSDKNGTTTRTYVAIDAKGKKASVTERFRYDPKEAALQVIEHDLSVMNVHGPEVIIPGKIGRTTDTYYAGSGNGAVGYYTNSGGYTQAGWDAIHDATTGNAAEYAQTSSNNLYSPGRWSNASVVQLSRTFYPINTSALGSDQVITNATWSIYVSDHYSASVPSGAPMSWALVAGTQASSTSLSTADFDAYTPTRIATDLASTSISDGSYNTWTLNADGRAAINKTGTTKLAMLASHDLDDYFTTSTNWVTRLLVRYADYAGTTYDPKLVVEHVTGSATTTIQNIAYAYDPVGNITQIADDGATDAKHTTNYSYDNLDRLLTASTTVASTSPFKMSYAYDALGNITGVSLNGAATTTYTYAQTGYANPHAATTYNGTTYTYDNNGNVTAAGTSAYTYDYLNRMSQSVIATATTTYGYDHAGARMFQQTASSTTFYPSRFYSMIATTSGATTTATSTEYIFLGDLLLATIDQLRINGTATGTPTPSFVHPDHLGSTGIVTNASGTPVQTLDYYPYGGTRVSSGAQLEKRQYIGQFTDPSALSYLNARYYDASRGQFTSEDPVFWEIGLTRDGKSALANPQALNSYGYGNGNPITNKDPLGRSPNEPGPLQEMQYWFANTQAPGVSEAKLRLLNNLRAAAGGATAAVKLSTAAGASSFAAIVDPTSVPYLLAGWANVGAAAFSDKLSNSLDVSGASYVPDFALGAFQETRLVQGTSILTAIWRTSALVAISDIARTGQVNARNIVANTAGVLSGRAATVASSFAANSQSRALFSQLSQALASLSAQLAVIQATAATPAR